jgi:hypothetical protein
MTITSGLLTPGELDFALSHAVNLAEAGRYLHENKIGTCSLHLFSVVHPLNAIRLSLL